MKGYDYRIPEFGAAINDWFPRFVFLVLLENIVGPYSRRLRLNSSKK